MLYCNEDVIEWDTLFLPHNSNWENRRQDLCGTRPYKVTHVYTVLALSVCDYAVT